MRKLACLRSSNERGPCVGTALAVIDKSIVRARKERALASDASLLYEV